MMESGESVQPLPEIVSEYKELLEGGKWAVKDAAGLSTVELSKPLEGGQTLLVRFDVRNVVEGVEEPFEDQEFEDTTAEEKDMEDMDFDQEHVFPLEVEVKAKDGKKLLLDLEVNAGASEDSVMVTNAVIVDPAVPVDNNSGVFSYGGPQYEQLDDGLREAMDAYANRLVTPDLVQFISDYAFSKESTQYGAWLENVKHVIKSD